MNLDAVRAITQKHLAETRAHLAHIASLEPSDVQVQIPLQAKVLNGLYYVQLYSALERTVNEAVQRSLSHIKTAAVQNNHAQTIFCTVTLFGEMMSIRNSADKSFVVKATNVFAKQAEGIPARINETCFGAFLQNVWMKTLDELFDAFGIERLQVDPRVRTTIDEITDNRNKIAHGRENASVVGERHRSTELRSKTEQVEILLYSLIDAFEDFCEHKKFINPAFRSIYTA